MCQPASAKELGLTRVERIKACFYAFRVFGPAYRKRNCYAKEFSVFLHFLEDWKYRNGIYWEEN